MVDLKKHPHPFEDHWARPGDCAICSRGDNDPIHVVKSPFDPDPRPLIPAENGYVWCEGCESVAPVTNHQCGKDPRLSYAWGLEDSLLATKARAEFAESLLCAEVFAHTIIRFERGHMDLMLWGPCDCALCDEARKP